MLYINIVKTAIIEGYKLVECVAVTRKLDLTTYRVTE
jgi:hypothetical protein